MTVLPRIKTIITLSIDHIDDEGRGIASITSNGTTITYAVRGAFPQDVVEAQVERVYSGAQIVLCRVRAFKEKGPHHIERECAHSHPCPACPLHDLLPDMALDLKRQRIRKALANVGLATLEVEPVIPQPSRLDYRQKVKLMVGGDPGHLVFGLYAPYTHNLVPAQQCAHVMPVINDALGIILTTLNATQIKPHSPHQGGLRSIIVHASLEGVSVICVTAQPMAAHQFSALKNLVDDGVLISVSERFDPATTNSVVGGNIIKHAGKNTVMPLEGGPAIDPDSFCQTDPVQAQKLYQLVAEYLAQEKSDGYFVDAFAGNGGFSRAILALGFKNIIAVEQASNSEAALKALPITTRISSMVDALPFLAEHQPLAGIVADPPKKGLGALALPLAQLSAKRFALVSCDPDAMARDLRVFTEQGYKVERIIPMDLFAGTPEIETVVFLQIL